MARSHAALVDRWLGLRTDEIEFRLHEIGSRERAPDASGEKQQLWFGLDVQALLTPYCELRSLLAKLELQPGMRVVDLGAAYGRMGFVIERHHPGVTFLGYEFVGERVREGRRVYREKGLVRSRLEHADLASPRFQPEGADVYFIYDYGSLKAIEKSLHDLRRLSSDRNVHIVCRGRHTRYLISSRHPWLSKAFPAEPEGAITVYRSMGSRGADGACEVGQY